MNHIRKSVSTTARQQKSQFTKEIAITMAHSEKTAGTHYDIFEQELASAQGANQIKNLFRDSPKTAESPSLPEQTTPKKRKKWSGEEVVILTEAIEKKTPIKSLPVNASPRQIYDKIRQIKGVRTY